MYITNVGYNHSHNADFNIDRPNGSEDCLLLLLKTPAIFTLNNHDIITGPDSFILYSENTPQNYRAYGAKFSNDWIHLKLHKEDDSFLNKLEIPRNQVIHIGDLNELSIIINNLCYENYGSNRYKYEIIELYLRLFFMKLSSKIYDHSNEIGNSHYNKMSIVRAKIYNQPYNNWNIEGLSREINMSKSCFQHLYKEFFGVGPITDVILSRIEHAKFLLSTTDISIKKISEMCGYNNEIHFMRQFKQHAKLTPSLYRESKRRGQS